MLKRQVCGIDKIDIGTQLFEVKLCAACRTQQVVCKSSRSIRRGARCIGDRVPVIPVISLCSVSDLCRVSSGFVKSRSSNLGLVRFRQNPSVKSVKISASPPDPPGSWTPNLGTSSVVGAGNLGFVNGSHCKILYCSVHQCRPGKLGYVTVQCGGEVKPP